MQKKVEFHKFQKVSHKLIYFPGLCGKLKVVKYYVKLLKSVLKKNSNLHKIPMSILEQGITSAGQKQPQSMNF